MLHVPCNQGDPSILVHLKPLALPWYHTNESIELCLPKCSLNYYIQNYRLVVLGVYVAKSTGTMAALTAGYGAEQVRDTRASNSPGVSPTH